MTTAAQPLLEPGRVYRTRELRGWSANPTRLAKRMVKEGALRQAAHGLFYAPRPTRFGLAPPSETELLRGFLDDTPFLISGPPRWNALGLGATALFAATLVYNRKRTGAFQLDGRSYLLRRVLFPKGPPPEYFVVDLIQHHKMAGYSLAELEVQLAASAAAGRWNTAVLLEMAARYGTKSTLALVERTIRLDRK